MLGEYFQGTLPQLIERARLLKAKIPRTLPRDYAALIQSCEHELDSIIAQLRALNKVPPGGSPLSPKVVAVGAPIWVPSRATR